MAWPRVVGGFYPTTQTPPKWAFHPFQKPLFEILRWDKERLGLALRELIPTQIVPRDVNLALSLFYFLHEKKGINTISAPCLPDILPFSI